MIDEEPSRYRSRTGSTEYVVNPIDSHKRNDIKQWDDPESMSVRNRELNPDAIRDTRDGSMVEHKSVPEIRKSGRMEETNIST